MRFLNAPGVFFAAFLLIQCGCASRLERFKTGMLAQDDMETVREGLPTPVLFFDGLARAYPKKEGILLTASQLNTAYGSLLLSEGADGRAAGIFLKARDYAFKAMVRCNRRFRNWFEKSFEEYAGSLRRFRKKDVPYMYYAAQAWLMWIIADDSWNSAADIPKTEELLRRILELDENYNYGMTHALLGSIYTSRPKIQGGRPAEAKKHFERALELSNREVLLVHVLYARQYAKLVYDRDLHDALLKEVLSKDPDDLPEEMRIMNSMAKKDAERLMEAADDYF